MSTQVQETAGGKRAEAREPTRAGRRSVRADVLPRGAWGRQARDADLQWMVRSLKLPTRSPPLEASTMSGVDAAGGLAYQHAHAIQLALLLAQDDDLDRIRVEAENDVVDA